MPTGKPGTLTYFLICLLLLFRSYGSFSQVAVQDSLALVSLYNATGGSQWNNNQNWLSTEVKFWQGVTIVGGRVQTLNLSANNLQGTLPDAICDLTALEYLFLSNNLLTGTLPACVGTLTAINSINLENNDFEGDIPPGIASFPLLADVWIAGNRFENMPAILSAPEISNVSMENNRFTFEDIVPNIGILNYSYAPQDSVLDREFLTIDIHNDITLTSLVGGNGNQYRWYKNNQPLSDQGTHIVGASTSDLVIDKITPADSGDYYCVITNPAAPLLMLTRRLITIHVNDTRLDQDIIFSPGGPVACGDFPIRVLASATSGLSLSYTVASGLAIMTTDTLQPFQPGLVTVTVFHEGNDFYKPVTKDTIIDVLPNPQSLLFDVEATSPVKEGGSLIVSVPLVAGMNYAWELPSGATTATHEVAYENADPSHAGWYFIRVNQNGCSVFFDSALVEIEPRPLIRYYELVTPDGDGKNDYFFIENIEYYPPHELIIFNVWNQVLFQTEEYKNDWKADHLPSGTYYFTFKSPLSDVFIKGTIYVRK